MATTEQRRLEEARGRNIPWRKWGPYLSERQWGTVREDYFHGDNGAGIGASHQTGWTGIVTWLLISAALLDPEQVVEKGFDAAALRRLVDVRHAIPNP